ncbi:MAG TPA: hypothetical protein DCM71_06280, partial [Runella sp.]|nr:hypothetical protein [Runella sp.]
FEKPEAHTGAAGFSKPAQTQNVSREFLEQVLLVSQNQRRRRMSREFLEQVLLVSQNQRKRRM